MMERHDHNNPWADKLQDIRVPGESDSWEAMEAVLDKEMPVGKWGDRRRWVLLVILLLLLIGVCNCPGRRYGHWQANGKDMVRHTTFDAKDTSLVKHVGGQGMGRYAGEDVERENSEKLIHGGPEREMTGGSERPIQHKKRKHKGIANAVGDATIGDDTAGGDIVGGDTAGGNIVGGEIVVGDKGKVLPKKLTPRQKADSTAAADRKAAKPDSVLEMKGWLVGLGLNQFFTVGQQQRSNYNSNGTTGGISDYIPVPMVRYYFSRKLFVQLEAQMNTPQYMQRNLVGSKSAVDSTSISNIRSQSVLYIKKLFYFNLPLSVHFSPFKNLYAGAGIQYSRLTNGVGVVQDKTLTITGQDSTVLSSKVQNFKGDSTYQKLKTNEFRLLFDMSYTYKRFIVGVRYNRALSKFLDVKIANNQVSQARNSSIQLYLRYIIWDKRKKQLLPK